VDEVADEAIDVPDFPEPGLTLLDLDVALNVPDTLPPGTEMARLDPGSYKLRLPGGEAWVRVTTDAEVFDDHAESHEFLSPGGNFFESLATPKVDDASAPREGPGHCWLVVRGGDAGTCEMFVASPEGPTPVHSLGVLLDRLSRLSTAGTFDITGQPPSTSVRCQCWSRTSFGNLERPPQISQAGRGAIGGSGTSRCRPPARGFARIEARRVSGAGTCRRGDLVGKGQRADDRGMNGQDGVEEVGQATTSEGLTARDRHASMRPFQCARIGP
jgi:hypothetical protein